MDTLRDPFPPAPKPVEPPPPLEATPTANQGSHLTGALGQSDGFVIAPHGSGPLPAGSTVDAVRLV